MTSQGTPIAWPLRTWLAVEVLFGVGAVLAIGLSPADTKTNFAWPIQPVVMAAVLGGFYITSAPLFILPFFAKRWEMIRTMILPVALFSTVQLAATFLHWDKFSVGTVPFYVWFASYLLPPPIFIAAYIWHQRKASSVPVDSDNALPTGLKRLLAIVGSLLTVGAVLIFLFPNLLIPNFPWQLTPLTARSLSGWLIAVGTIMLSISRENNQTRAILATPMLILILPALLLQMLRYADQVDWATRYCGWDSFYLRSSSFAAYISRTEIGGKRCVDMSKYLQYGILEDIDKVRRIPIGRFWGINLLITPLTWLGPFVFFGLHILLNLTNSGLSLTDRLYKALLFTIAVEITTILHAFGHILSGKMVHSAMDELLITATRDVNLYHGDQKLIPGHVHLVRSLGGPVFNLLIAGLCSALAIGIVPGFWSDLVASLISTNRFFGFGSFLPLPSVDGEVIWRELLRPIYERLKMKDVSPESKKKSPQPQVSQDKE